MNRRGMLRLLGSAAIPALAGLTPERLFALAEELHRRLAAPEPRSLRVLDRHQNEIVTAIAEMIIPETDTPGARAARVNEFIDLIVAEWYDGEERERFLSGIGGVDARSRSTFGSDFLSRSETERVALLRALDAEVSALREARKNPDQHFFQQMKWLTVYGYYTSELGVTLELKEEVVPGRYDPCVATGIPSRRGQ